jgi:hypothetical protein
LVKKEGEQIAFPEKRAPTSLAAGEKEKDPQIIPSNHAIFILPPSEWDKSQIREDSTGKYYLVENVWVREQLGRDKIITYHYYVQDYDINPANCWFHLTPKKEVSTAIKSDLPEVVLEIRKYTPEELAAIKQRRRELMYIIASDDNLFLKFYLNEKYSQEFRTELYHMNIAIGRGEVAMATAAVGFSFMAAAAAPALIESGLVKGLLTDVVVDEVIEKMSDAVGLPIGEILDFKDAKSYLKSVLEKAGKKGVKALPPYNKADTPELKAGKRPSELNEVDKSKSTHDNKTDVSETDTKRPGELDEVDRNKSTHDNNVSNKEKKAKENYKPDVVHLTPEPKRHKASSINKNSKPHSDENTLADNSVDMVADVQAINRGEATLSKDGTSYELPNGRIYGRKGDYKTQPRLFPKQGTGFHTLTRGGFETLKALNELGKEKGLEQIKPANLRRRIPIPQSEIDDAIKVFNLIN